MTTPIIIAIVLALIAILAWLFRHTLADLLAGVRPCKEFEYTPRKLIGVGPCVNYWHRNSPWPIARALRKAGLNSTAIEVFGWACTSLHTNPEAAIAALNRWVAVMRRYRITTLCILVNQNSEETKYGHVGTPLSTHMPAIAKVHAAILKLGPKGIIYQAVAECSRPSGQAIERLVVPAASAAGFITASENNGRTAGGQADIIIRHPGSTRDTGVPGILILTDSQILRELSEGGLFETAFANPAALRKYAAAVLATGAGFIHYAFGPRTPDYGAIKSLKGLKPT